MIQIDWEDELMQEMAEFYSSIEPKSFYYTHYELAALDKAPTHNPSDWKTFITHPEVSDYISREIRLLQQAELRKMLQNISKSSGSVATAQNLTALLRVIDADKNESTGPIFVYTYVPLNENEQHAPNVNILDRDPFRREI